MQGVGQLHISCGDGEVEDIAASGDDCSAGTNCLGDDLV
jgi:hypothetical protein